MIRRAVPADIRAIVALAIEALAKDAYAELVVSAERVRNTATECVSAASHFAWVAERDGRVGGALVALVTPNMFHERNCASILMWYSKLPGEGMALLREFLRWAGTRPAVKMIQYTGERNADPRITRLLAKRYGFHQLPFFVRLY